MKGLRKRLAASAGIAILACSGCASNPPATSAAAPGTERRDAIELVAFGMRRAEPPSQAPASPTSGFPWNTTPPVPDPGFPSLDATCTASNDRGTWTVVLPGRLEVVPSGAPLKLTCAKQGYRDSTMTFKCVTPRTRRAAATSAGLLQFLAFMPPVALVALPVMAGMVAGTAATGAAVGASLPGGPGDDDCTYFGLGKLDVWMSVQP